ncbi:3-hydroxyacyl-CoA dehydrogenase [Bosea sp. OK403]|jgi:3-hydroxyacyl-CoA dehydrogenase|uniref:3-hydroxyacyl-CoA dehydrogenase n=1 Tax=Bosea sp. OK403 TaxID=1855286 RepID=UPI0008E3F7EF|nr:3-hydroxyacyl-CoA dehydrogenase [Bosea sp. OK403]SFJ74166.1 3-hydroxyacyl-CoA dehydrogenase [Bosea sp. OK403]
MITTIIGSGLIGRSWAISFARAGHEVRLWDRAPAAAVAALGFARSILPELAAHELLGGQTPDEVFARLHPVEDLADALSGAGYVQESTPETVEGKRTVFAEIDRLAPAGAVLASSTSAILPSHFMEAVPGRARCLVCHPINPPYLVPAVEVCPSPWTAPETVKAAADFMRGCGQRPLLMKREIDGYIMNRMQGALLDEAFRLVEDGIADVEAIDIGLREGLALRWSFMGPFETIDLNAPGGVRDYAARYQPIYAGIAASVTRRSDWTGPVMDAIETQRAERLDRDQLVERQLWRDRRLMALLAHKRAAARDLGE